MVLLRNDGPTPLLFSIAPEAPSRSVRGSPLDDDASATEAAAQLLEVRPVRGVVPPGQDVQLQVAISGDEWALRGAQRNPELSFRVRVGREFSGGGDAMGQTTTLTFTAECLTHL